MVKPEQNFGQSNIIMKCSQRIQHANKEREENTAWEGMDTSGCEVITRVVVVVQSEDVTDSLGPHGL